MPKLKLILGCLLLTSFSFGMNVEEVLKQVRENYTNVDQLEYFSTFELYKGHMTGSIHSSYSGYTYRKGSEVYQKIDQTEFIYGANYFLKISHKEKKVMLDLPQKNINMDIDPTVFLKNCSEKHLEDKGKYYSITLKYSYGGESPFGEVKMRVNKKNFDVLQLDFYYATQRDFSEDFRVKDFDRPHLKIKFEKMTRKPKTKNEFFDLEKYVINLNNLLSTTNYCNGYELIDNRVK